MSERLSFHSKLKSAQANTEIQNSVFVPSQWASLGTGVVSTPWLSKTWIMSPGWKERKKNKKNITFGHPLSVSSLS